MTSNGQIDVNDRVTLDSLEAIKQLNLANKDVKSVKGIGYLKNIENLWLHNTKIQSIDVTNNIELLDFGISGTQIDSIDLSKNIKLIDFVVSNVKMKELDLSNQINLELLFLGNRIEPEGSTSLETLILPDNSNCTSSN